MHHHQEVGRRLLGDDADALHFLRQARQRLRDAVLDLHLRVVEVGAEREGRGQRHHAVGGRLRIHVEQAFDAVDLLLERRGDRFGDDLRVGARIDAAHHHGRRHDARILADRQREQRDAAADDDQERQDDREDRTVDEEMRELHDCGPTFTSAAASIGTGRDVHLHAGADALQAVHDDHVAGVEAGPHHAQAVDDRPERDDAVLDLARRADDEDEPLVEVGADGAVLDQQAAIARGARQAQADEEARRQAQVGVAKDRARANRARRRIHLVVEEVHLALARERLVSGQRHLDGQARLARAGALAGARQVAVAEEGLLVGVERRVDRIERDDGREQRRLARPGRDEVAFGDDGAADAPGDRRGDARELEVQFRGAQRRFDGRCLRGGLLGERGAAIELLVRDRVLGGQPFRALELGGGALNRGAGAQQLGAQAIDLGLERPRVDHEQQVAARDDRAFLEADRGDVARHARPDGDGVDGLEAAGEFIPLGEVARDHLGGRHLWRRRGGGLCRRPRARRQRRRRHHRENHQSLMTKTVEHVRQHAPRRPAGTIGL